jgi:hypothetical protein
MNLVLPFMIKLLMVVQNSPISVGFVALVTFELFFGIVSTFVVLENMKKMYRKASTSIIVKILHSGLTLSRNPARKCHKCVCGRCLCVL